MESASTSSTESDGARSATEENRLAKEAESDSDIGLVRLRSGDRAARAKDQQHLEHLLFSRTGKDNSNASNDDGRSDDEFEAAIALLERGSHHAALNRLTTLREGGSMKDDDFRRQMADAMLKVADSAYKTNKVRGINTLPVAADAYEGAYATLKHDEAAGENVDLALRGSIRCHKLLAMECEGIQSYSQAIPHRCRVHQLLDESGRTVPACEQMVKVAHLYAEDEEYAQSAMALSQAIRRLRRGVKSLDDVASDRMDLLIQCHQMQAICHAKLKKWEDALVQYDEVLPLVVKRGGWGSKEYSSALIHKSALLVTMGNHRSAASSINEYLELAEISDPDLIVDDSDHLLALDTSAATFVNSGNADEAISAFERKLAFVETLPDSDEMKSDTLHKLGCLLANQNKPEKALPLLNEALTTVEFGHDGKHRSVVKTALAVAATNHTLGDSDKALEEYSLLMANMSTVSDMPLDNTSIHNSAGKLFFEDGKLDQSIQSLRQALHETQTSGNLQLKSEIMLNLANALSAKGEADDAIELYGQLLSTKSLKKTKISSLARFNKSLLLIKMGKVKRGKGILNKIAEDDSAMANDVRGKVYSTLGGLALSDGSIDEALGYFEKSLDVAGCDDFSARADAKRSIALAQLEAGQMDEAISTLNDVLEDLFNSGAEGQSVNLQKAELWNCLARAYRMKEDLHQAKNFAKLALQTHKAELGETDPTTLRNVSNLQLLLLEEAESLEKSEAKQIIEAAKFELEETLEAFTFLLSTSLNGPETRHLHLDVASVKTNLGFIAIWMRKPKKARKFLRQLKQTELPLGHPLVHRIAILQERVEALEMKGKK